MMPTTAAVIAASAAEMRGARVIRSTYGAPRKMNTNDGRNVAQDASSAAMKAETSGSRAPGWFQPAMKPMNCSTITSGPGVVSASARPATDCSAVSQPRSCTRCCVT